MTIFLKKTLFLLLAVAPLARGQGVGVVCPTSPHTEILDTPFYLDRQVGASWRYQQVYGAADFARLGSSMMVTGLTLVGSLTGNYCQYDVTLPNVQINLSTTTAAPDSLSPVFANNVGTDAITVLSGSLHITFNPITGDSGINIAFPSAFYYDPTRGNLLMDIRSWQTLPITTYGYAAMWASRTNTDYSSRLVAFNVDATAAQITDTAALRTVINGIAVPEPSTNALLLTGGAAFWLLGRKRLRAILRPVRGGPAVAPVPRFPHFPGGGRNYEPAYASMPAQEQTGLRSPKTLSMRPTLGQNLCSRSQRAG